MVVNQEQRRKKAASLKRTSVAEGLAMRAAWDGERCFSIGAQERGATIKKFCTKSPSHYDQWMEGLSYHPKEEVKHERQVELHFAAAIILS